MTKSEVLSSWLDNIDLPFYNDRLSWAEVDLSCILNIYSLTHPMVSQAKIADKMGISPTAISRLMTSGVDVKRKTAKDFSPALFDFCLDIDTEKLENQIDVIKAIKTAALKEIGTDFFRNVYSVGPQREMTNKDIEFFDFPQKWFSIVSLPEDATLNQRIIKNVFFLCTEDFQYESLKVLSFYIDAFYHMPGPAPIEFLCTSMDRYAIAVLRCREFFDSLETEPNEYITECVKYGLQISLINVEKQCFVEHTTIIKPRDFGG